MYYKDFIRDLAFHADCSQSEIRRMFQALPRVLMSLDEEESIRTPIGVFTKQRRKEKKVFLPNSDVPSYAPEMLQIKLKIKDTLKEPA